LEVNKAECRVVAEETIKVPAGTFDCVQVETKIYKGELQRLSWVRTDWFAAGVGVVKSTGGPIEKRVKVLKTFVPGKD